jgi:GAF domain-containing protein
VALTRKTDRNKLANEQSKDDSGSLALNGQEGAARLRSALSAAAELGRRLLAVRAVVVAIEGDASSSIVAFDPDDSLVVQASKNAHTLADPVAAGDLGLRFYAGIPLHGAGGRNLGILAAVDGDPRELSDEQLESLKLAACIATELIASGETAESTDEKLGPLR